MASIFKRSKKKNAVYSVQYTDHKGKRKTVKGFTDKGLTEELAAKLEGDARLRSTGLIDVEQEEIVKRKQSAIEEHLIEFESSLSEESEKYQTVTMSRIRCIVEGAKIEKLADIQIEPIQKFLKTLKKLDDLAPRTYNHYIQAVFTFGNWCVITKRLVANPLVGMERLNTEVDIRRKRRALKPNEVARLLVVAQASRKKVQTFTGEKRARIYLLSYATGLRKNEISSLSPRSFDLDVIPATVTVEARFSKHRKRDVLPLHPDFVPVVKEWVKELRPTEKLFPLLARKSTSIMIRKDLAVAEIPFETHEGRADFHAAGRHTHITELLRNGVSLPEAQKLARHTDINMTMRYTHIGMDDRAKAIKNLPMPNSKMQDALQMRCISGGSDGHEVTLVDRNDPANKSINPCQSKGLVMRSQLLALTDKMPKVGVEPTHP